MKLAVDHAEMVNRLVLFDAAGTYFPGYTDLQSVFDARDVASVNRLFAMLTPHPRPIPEFIAKNLVRRRTHSALVRREDSTGAFMVLRCWSSMVAGISRQPRAPGFRCKAWSPSWGHSRR
jgi:pimeloyl-ACP methyl ester carboxylesterase